MARIYIPLPKDASPEEIVRLVREAAEAHRLGEAASESPPQSEPEDEDVEEASSVEEPSDQK